MVMMMKNKVRMSSNLMMVALRDGDNCDDDAEDEEKKIKILHHVHQC